MNNGINVLVTDDHALITDGIITVLKEIVKLNHMQICHTPQEAIDSSSKENFNLYILDLGFRDNSNIDIRCIDYIRAIDRKNPNAKIIVYTMREDFGIVSLLSKIKSVKGIVLKGPEKKYLQEATIAVLSGQKYLCPRFIKVNNHCEKYKDRLKKKKIKNGPPNKKEIEILKLLAAGYNSKEIAEILINSQDTIETYRRNLKFKFEASSTVDLVIMAIILNYINLEDVALHLLKQ